MNKISIEKWSIKRFIRELDELFSKVIRIRDKKCVKCGEVRSLHCAHIFSRSNRSTRWYLDNAVTLCYYCHFHWAHEQPIEFTEFIKKRISSVRYEKLRLLAKEQVKLFTQDFIEIKNRLENELQRITRINT